MARTALITMHHFIVFDDAVICFFERSVIASGSEKMWAQLLLTGAKKDTSQSRSFTCASPQTRRVSQSWQSTALRRGRAQWQLVIAPILKPLAGKWRVNVICRRLIGEAPSQRAHQGRPWLGGSFVSEPHVHFNVLKQLRASERVPEMLVRPSQVISNGWEK